MIDPGRNAESRTNRIWTRISAPTADARPKKGRLRPPAVVATSPIEPTASSVTPPRLRLVRSERRHRTAATSLAPEVGRHQVEPARDADEDGYHLDEQVLGQEAQREEGGRQQQPGDRTDLVYPAVQPAVGPDCPVAHSRSPSRSGARAPARSAGRPSPLPVDAAPLCPFASVQRSKSWIGSCGLRPLLRAG